jgi:hypothetical protein
MNYPQPNISNNIFNLINRKTISSINHNNLSNINEGSLYKHVTLDQLNKIDNYVSLSNDGILSKIQWYELTKIRNSINLLNNPYTGIIYGDNNGYIIQDEDMKKFLFKSSNSENIVSITDSPKDLLDLTTKLYVDKRISEIQYNHSEVILYNSNILLKTSELNNNVLNLINDNNIPSDINIGTLQIYINNKISAIELINSQLILQNTELLEQIANINLNILSLINKYNSIIN